jgi:hypothetical protein
MFSPFRPSRKSMRRRIEGLVALNCMFNRDLQEVVDQRNEACAMIDDLIDAFGTSHAQQYRAMNAAREFLERMKRKVDE